MISTGKISLFATAIVVSASMIEAWVLSRKKTAHFDWHEVMLSLADLVGRKLLALLPLSLATPVFAFAWDHRIYTATINSALMVLLLFVGQEFFYYWYHRARRTASASSGRRTRFTIRRIN
jgi:sterol desaturase/sphingolipid hydroxylase (fatty acid hydroxylase superfamily)